MVFMREFGFCFSDYSHLTGKTPIFPTKDVETALRYVHAKVKFRFPLHFILIFSVDVLSSLDTNSVDVLDDIGNMLANLTTELDAMLEDEKRQGLNDD